MHPHRRHQKFKGRVTDPGPPLVAEVKEIGGEGRDLIVEFKDESRFHMPSDRKGVDWYFYWHIDKRGRTYLFWPPLPPPHTRSRMKKIWTEASHMHQILAHGEGPCDCLHADPRPPWMRAREVFYGRQTKR